MSDTNILSYKLYAVINKWLTLEPGQILPFYDFYLLVYAGSWPLNIDTEHFMCM
jgi:hypothetical protein